ncbi:MAG: carboxypeptidase regulatory-like domain-containing protein [Terriglobia bacterium]
MKSMSIRSVSAALAALFVMACAGAQAQIRTQASLSGYVSDPSGAMIPNATVSVINSQTGVANVVHSNSSGYYYVPSLNPGTYKIDVKAAGFKSVMQTGYVINVGDHASLDFHLAVGSIAQTVTVAGQISHLQTNTAEISDVIAGSQIQQLAVNGRNFMTMAKLVPGAAAAPGNTGLGHLANDIAFNGGRTEESTYYLDGAWDNDPGSKTSLDTSPAIAAVSEFRVVTSNYSAEYGGAGAAVVNVDIKSGTNQFHGEGYEFLRNDALDAPQLFVKNTPPLKLNDFGFTVGGPIKKDKLFFFYSSEWRRQEAGAAFSTHTPTAAELAGDFSQFTSVLPKGGTLKVPSGVSPSCISGTDVNPKCFDPQAVVLAQSGIFPGVTNPSSFQDYQAAPSLPTNFNQELFRIDYNLSSKLKLMGHYIQEGYDLNPGVSMWSNDNFPTVSTNFQVPSKNLVVQLTQFINPKMFNETEFGYSDDSDIGNPVGTYKKPSGLTIPEVYPQNPDNRIPSLQFSQGYGSYDVAYWPYQLTSPIRTYQDTFTQILGRHTLKYGAVYQYDMKNQPAQIRTQGQFNFNGEFTGNSLADFLLGLPSSYSETNLMLTGFWRYHQLEAFVQDDFKVSPRLSLSLGVRYFYIPHLYTTNNEITNFVPSTWSASQAPKLDSKGNIVPGTGSLTNGLVQAGHGISRSLVNSYHNDFGPRFGFSWDPTGRGNTVLRGGYGITYFRVQGNDSYNILGNPPFATTFGVTAPPLDNPAGGAAAPITPSSLLALDQNYYVPMVQQYSLGVQRLLPADSMLTVSYVGSHGDHLQSEIDLNQPLPYQNFEFNPILNASGTPENIYRPYQGWGTIDFITPGANSVYNSLQVEYEKQMARNFRFQASYTWSKSEDDASSYNNQPQNAYDRNANWAVSDYDRPQMLVFNYIYDLPFFRGERGVRGEALGGWELAGVTTYESGTPLTIGLTGSNHGLASRPNVNGQRLVLGSIPEWFDTAIYSVPAPGFFGNSGRNVIRGPALGEWDISLYKQFAFSERAHLQLRIESFNAFNHTNLSGVSTSLGSGSFGQVTSALSPRIFQLGARLMF